MTQTNTSYACSKCQRSLTANQKPCPDCGSERRQIKISIQDQIKVRDSLGLKKFRQGVKSFIVHQKQGWFSSKDTDKHPDGVQLTQLVDRENNLYKKRVIDEKTGSVIKDLEEPLDQHK